MTDFAKAAPELRRPFTPAAVKFKPQSTTKSGKTLCVAYIDARLVVERLNHVVPAAWSDAYRPVGDGLMWCDLTIDGITRSDVGEGKGKALVSDALKRAAVKFGVGVSLYAVPSMLLPGEVRMLYPDSREVQTLRASYEWWLKDHGIKAFGEPLDHGDAPDSVGDEADSPQETPAPIVDEVTAEAATARAAGVDVRAVFEGMDVVPLRAVKQTLRSMTPEAVEQFRARLAEAVTVAEAKAKLGAEEVPA